MRLTALAVAISAVCALHHSPAFAADSPLADAPSADASARPLSAKQLAGPPEEFASMAPVLAVDTAIYSKSALIPVRFSDQKSGLWQKDIPLDSPNARVLLINNGTEWKAQIGDNSAESMADLSNTEFGMQGNRVGAQLLEFRSLDAGRHNIQLERLQGSASEGFLLVEGDESKQLVSYVHSRSKERQGERIHMLAHMVSDSNQARLSNAQLSVKQNGIEWMQLEMVDDGQHFDGKAGDGLFGGNFLVTEGEFVAQVSASGIEKDQAFIRTAEHLLPVIASKLDVIGDADLGQTRSIKGMVEIQIPVRSEKLAHARGFAEVWGKADSGKMTPVAWVSGMVQAVDGRVSFGLDQRWLQLAGVSGGLELRNVRFEDPDHFLNLTSLDRLAVRGDVTLSKAKGEIKIDEQMLMGPRPQDAQVAKGVGSRLLLVHGYCSGAVWPTSQFSNASTFLDANQNRSHDQFARLISSYGSTWNSFGVVAHSQGGAASLHLYTYYWSGLDRATGSRLIQSVGTPYKGTNLAGVLAAVGGVFGVGCGLNNDLTYSGASSWLAGIPNSSRAKVNYYTTSFRSTNWWTNDYCNFATDLVLGDPEDGTTEQVNGQLSGGVNRGHVTGQCHTAGMRDPAQYHDSARNATMNSNAAR